MSTDPAPQPALFADPPRTLGTVLEERISRCWDPVGRRVHALVHLFRADGDRAIGCRALFKTTAPLSFEGRELQRCQSCVRAKACLETPTVRAYECRLPLLDEDYLLVVHATSASKARAECVRQLRAGGAAAGFPDVRVRSMGAPVTSERLRRVASYRGRPELVAGVRVLAAGNRGTVVDADDSCNFVVLFDAGTRHAGRLLPVHPGDVILLPAAPRGSRAP